MANFNSLYPRNNTTQLDFVMFSFSSLTAADTFSLLSVAVKRTWRSCHCLPKRPIPDFSAILPLDQLVKRKEPVASCQDDDATIVLRRQNSKARLYSTLRLKQLRSIYKSLGWQPEEVEEEGDEDERIMGQIKGETTNVGCKVLPICDAVLTASSKRGGASGGQVPEKDVQKRRAVSRMKELLRWAAAAKSTKAGGKGYWKALYFRHKMTLKAAAEVDDSSSTSSKIGFKWEAGSCSSSAVASLYSSLSLPSTSRNDPAMAKSSSVLSLNLRSSDLDPNLLGSPKSEDYVRNGQWITTDSEFVVLEL